MRLIDADALNKTIDTRECFSRDWYVSWMTECIDNAPTIAAIPVEWIEDMLREWHKNKAPFEAIGAVSGMLVRWQKEQEAQDAGPKTTGD